MKVLIIIEQAFNPTSGGVQHTTYKMGKYLSLEGCEMLYFSFQQEGHIIAEFGNLHTVKANKGVNNPENLNTLDQLLQKESPDIVINQSPFTTPLRNFLSSRKHTYKFKLIGCLRNTLLGFQINGKENFKSALPKAIHPFIINPVGMFLLGLRNNMLQKRLLKSIIEKHDLFVLLTPSNQKELETYLKDYNKSKVICIPNSIEEVLPVLPKKKNLVLHVGRIVIEQKRSELLMRVWKQILKKEKDWTFEVVGDGEYLPKLKNEIEKDEIERVTLHGFTKPNELYKRASIFIMTSAYEGFPNVVLEAQSFGAVPVAFSSYGAINDVVNNGTDAVLVKPFDCELMAEEVVKLMHNPKVLQEMQESALQNARNYVTPSVVKQWISVFNEILSK